MFELDWIFVINYWYKYIKKKNVMIWFVGIFESVLVKGDRKLK